MLAWSLLRVVVPTGCWLGADVREFRFASGLITVGIGVDVTDDDGEEEVDFKEPKRISSKRLLVPSRPPSGVLSAEVGFRKPERLLGRLL